MTDFIHVRAAVNRCVRCGRDFPSPTGTARYCQKCRKTVMSEHAKRRGLSRLGVEARWSKTGGNK